MKNIELFNPHVLKILISTREIDSISSISQRIDLSYGWTNKWVNELIKEGIFKKKYKGIKLNKKNKTYKNIIKFIQTNLNNVSFYYSALNLFGIKYCFTKTDAVYFWTQGRYNIARYRDYYPIFIKIKKSDYDLFLYYCKKLNLNINQDSSIFYKPEIVKKISCSIQKGVNVEKLEKTIEFMKNNIYNFQPALEIIQEKYKKKLNIKYSEANFYA